MRKAHGQKGAERGYHCTPERRGASDVAASLPRCRGEAFRPVVAANWSAVSRGLATTTQTFLGLESSGG